MSDEKMPEYVTNALNGDTDCLCESAMCNKHWLPKVAAAIRRYGDERAAPTDASRALLERALEFVESGSVGIQLNARHAARATELSTEIRAHLAAPPPPPAAPKVDAEELGQVFARAETDAWHRASAESLNDPTMTKQAQQAGALAVARYVLGGVIALREAHRAAMIEVEHAAFRSDAERLVAAQSARDEILRQILASIDSFTFTSGAAQCRVCGLPATRAFNRVFRYCDEHGVQPQDAPFAGDAPLIAPQLDAKALTRTAFAEWRRWVAEDSLRNGFFSPSSDDPNGIVAKCVSRISLAVARHVLAGVIALRREHMEAEAAWQAVKLPQDNSPLSAEHERISARCVRANAELIAALDSLAAPVPGNTIEALAREVGEHARRRVEQSLARYLDGDFRLDPGVSDPALRRRIWEWYDRACAARGKVKP